MTRICCACKKVLGEKCGKCGAVSDPRPGAVDPLLQQGNHWMCLLCGHTWKEGDEPATHGFCEECYAKSKGETL